MEAVSQINDEGSLLPKMNSYVSFYSFFIVGDDFIIRQRLLAKETSLKKVAKKYLSFVSHLNSDSAEEM
jgi:hypothetical protein